MGSTWGQQDPGGPHFGPINLAILVMLTVVWCSVLLLGTWWFTHILHVCLWVNNLHYSTKPTNISKAQQNRVPISWDIPYPNKYRLYHAKDGLASAAWSSHYNNIQYNTIGHALQKRQSCRLTLIDMLWGLLWEFLSKLTAFLTYSTVLYLFRVWYIQAIYICPSSKPNIFQNKWYTIQKMNL